MKPNFKIAIIWEQLTWGGVDSYLKYLIEDWPNQNDQLVIYHNDTNAGAIRLREEISHVKFVKFSAYKSRFIPKEVSSNIFIRIFRYFLIPILILTEKYKFIKLLKYENVDILISQNGGYPAAWGTLSAIFAAKNLCIPVRALVIHHKANKPSTFQFTFRSILDKNVAKSVTSIIPISFATKQSLYDNTNLLEDEKYSNAPVIYNGVPVSSLGQSKFILKSYIPNYDGEFVVGILGRIEAYKGHFDLISAFSRLDECDQLKIFILIIGKGEESEVERLKQYAKNVKNGNRIIFTGFISENSQTIIKSLDLLIMASRSFEGFGLTIAEAMSVKVPVIATNVGAVSEFVSQSMVTLINPGDVHQLSNAIIDFITNNLSWKEKANYAYLEVIKFSSKKMAKEYRDHLVQNFIIEKYNPCL